MKTTLIFFFSSLLIACTGSVLETEFETTDMAHNEDIAPLTQGGPSTAASGTDKCSAADCNTPLNKTVEFSNPAMVRMGR